MRNKRRYGRRGMSTVVTSLLLVVAVAIMGTYLVAWANSSFAVQQRDIADQTAKRINLVKEDFIIEDVWFYIDGPDRLAKVTIRNTGELALEVSHIYINNTQVWNTGETILIDERAEIQVGPTGTNWGSGNNQNVWVKTERGSEAKQVWKS